MNTQWKKFVNSNIKRVQSPTKHFKFRGYKAANAIWQSRSRNSWPIVYRVSKYPQIILYPKFLSMGGEKSNRKAFYSCLSEIQFVVDFVVYISFSPLLPSVGSLAELSFLVQRKIEAKSGNIRIWQTGSVGLGLQQLTYGPGEQRGGEGRIS